MRIVLTDVEYTAKGKFKLPIAVVARQIGPIWNDYCGNGEAESERCNFLRNLMIVGILQYFARRSDRFVLSLIANIGLLALVGYTISFLHVFSLNLFSRRGIVWIVVDAVVYVVTFGLLLFGISFGIFAAINEIMLFQER